MAARILITGGAGFIGSHLARRHLAEGDDVHLLVRPETSLHRLTGLLDHVAVHQVSLDDEAALARLFAEVEPTYVYHMAVETRRREMPGLGDAFACVNEDLLRFLRLLKAATEAPRAPACFVQTGTLASYGPIEPPFRESQREHPLTPYAAAKISTTHFAHALQGRLPFRIAVPRLALIFGPGQSEDFLIPHLIANCLAGRPSRVQRPQDRRDLLHVDEAVDGLRQLAIRAPEGMTLVNIASGIAPSMREVAECILRATGADPALVEFGDGQPPSGICELRCATELAKELIGWSSREHWTQGIDRVVAGLRGSAPERAVAA